MIRVQFEFGKNDVIAYAAHHARRSAAESRAHMRIRWLAVVAVVLIGTFIAVELEPLLGTGGFRALDPAVSVVAVGLLAVVCLATAFAPLYAEWQTRSTLARGELARCLGRTLCEFRDDELYYECERWKGSTKHRNILAVEERPEHLFIYTTESRAFVIPKRAFADPREIQVAIDAIRTGNGRLEPGASA